MKKYCLGVRNSVKHNYSIVLNTNSILLANIISIIIKPFVNEVNIANTNDIVIIDREPPFDNQYYHK